MIVFSKDKQYVVSEAEGVGTTIQIDQKKYPITFIEKTGKNGKPKQTVNSPKTMGAFDILCEGRYARFGYLKDKKVQKLHIFITKIID